MDAPAAVDLQSGSSCAYALGVFRKVLLETSIKPPQGQSSHILRHTFAAHFIMGGGHIVTLKEILGHASLSMTMRYAHLAPEHLSEAIRLGPMASFGRVLE